MSRLKKKTSFENIRALLLKADITLGLYLLKAPPEKKSIREWIYKLTLIRHVILCQGFFISTLITTNFKLINVIFCGLGEFIIVALYTALINCIANKQKINNFLAWCEGLYDVEKNFHSLVQNLVEQHLIIIESQATKVLKVFRILIYGNIVIETFGFLILGLILPDSILPKFIPPAPFYLPFKCQDNWIAFLVTMLAQSFVLFDVATMLIYIFSVLYTVIIHIFGYLELIDQVVKRLKQEIDCETSLLKGSKNKKIQQTFEDSIKVITEMISYVSPIVSMLTKLYSKTFLALEISSYAALFICGLIFTVLHQQYLFALGVSVGALILCLMCYINEKILDKFDDIKESLYDIPWYELEPKQSKMLLIVLNCDKIQSGFTAGGIHILTMERFGIVLKDAYKNVLVLKDLVQK